MQLDSTRFARAVRLIQRERDARRVAFDLELSDRSTVPAFVESYAEGVFRLRLGTQTLPDYGLVLAPARAIDAVVGPEGRVRVTSGGTTLILEQDPLRAILERAGSAVLGPITDEHFRGWTRMPAFGRDADRWIASFGLSSGEPVYGLGEKFSSLNRRGQLLHSYVEDALGVNTGLSYKTAPFCWSPEGWGVFLNTVGRVSHGVGYPEWSHRSYIAVVEDEALDAFLLTADSPAGLLSCYTELTGRAPEVPTWGLGLWVSRAYY